jgi:peptide deformylase
VAPEVVVYPDRRLKTPCAPIEEIGPGILAAAAALQEVARVYPRTVGVAAPQIGALVRLVLVDCTGHKQVPAPRSPRILVNPVVTAHEGSEVGREGCLSLPEVTANVRRAARIEVVARDLAGGEVRFEADGFEARVVLHELDHLDGVLILDRVASAGDIFPRRARSRPPDVGGSGPGS